MRLKAVLLILLVTLFITPGILYAQRSGNSLLSFSAGIVTVDEFKGVTYTSYMDIPFAYSGAAFLSYRYFITDHVAVGLSAGMDDVKGNLTFGNPKFNGTNMEGTAGTYIRHTYTLAPEIFLKYHQNNGVMLYGYCGVGYTFSKVEKAYDPQLYASAYQNGVNPNAGSVPAYLSPTNPYYEIESHLNGQITALGIRIGEKVAWDIEFGFGYKGVINTGLSVKL
jgi:hypothetical protein